VRSLRGFTFLLLIFTAFNLAVQSSPAAADKVCSQVSVKKSKGEDFMTTKCLGTNGCQCSASKCVIDVVLPSTGAKSKQTKITDVKCTPISSPFPGDPNKICKAVQMDRKFGQCFHGPCCHDKKGCVCSATQCGPKVPKHVGDIKFSDVKCTPK